MFLANFLIALREGVEAALVVSILIAYLVQVGRRDVLPKVWTGIVLAALIPLAMGAFMTWGPYTLSFQAQELIGGGLSLVAVGFITWMIFWMGKNAKQIAGELRSNASKALATGSTVGIIWLAAVAVGREGIETAVFVWATVRSSAQTSALEPVLGVILGLICAIALGWLIHAGAARINLRQFFTWTGYALIVVAAGVVSYGLGDLQEAGLIPGWGIWAYDLSGYFDQGSWLSSTSWWFVLLEAMFNLNLSPTHLQLIGWSVYLVLTLFLFTRQIFGAVTAVANKNDEADTQSNSQNVNENEKIADNART